MPFAALDGQDGAGERGLAVVDVADGAHIDVRFGPSKILPWPLWCYSPCNWIKRVG